MPIKIVRPNHFELLGEGYVLLTAPHAAEPEAELYTGKIVEDAALSSRCYAVVGKLGPEYQDPYKVQTARAELRSSVESTLEENEIRFLLDIRGKEGTGVGIDISDNPVAFSATTELVKARLSKNFTVLIDTQSAESQPQSAFPTSGRKSGAGHLFEALRLSLGQAEIGLKRELVINTLVELIVLLNGRVHSQGVAK